METLKKFCSEFDYFIRKELAYYNLSKDEIEQECAIVWYENKMIELTYLENKNYQAFAIFRKALKQSASSYSIKGSTTEYKQQRESELKAFSKLVIEDEDLTDKVYDSILISQIKDVLSPEDYEFMCNYYNIGKKSTAKMYGITYVNARVKAMRIINKAKERINV